MIHQAILAMIRTVNYPCLLHMDQRCGSRRRSRTAEKRQRQQILGASWVLRAQITADSDWWTAGSEGDVENEERNAKINAHLQSLFGAQFQILFGKIHEIVSYFVIFCNLINILDVGTDSNDAAEIKLNYGVTCNLNKPEQ